MTSDRARPKGDLPKGFFEMELISNNPWKMKRFIEGCRRDKAADDG